jgi:hypothetical protein
MLIPLGILSAGSFAPIPPIEDRYIAVAHYDSPRISAFPWSAGFGTKYSAPATGLPARGFSVAFSPSGSDLAAGHRGYGSSMVSAYPFSASGFGTRYANPATLPTGYGYGVAFSRTGNDIAVAHSNSPRITAYPWSSGFGTKYANPGILPDNNSFAVAFLQNDIAVAHTSSPRITAYPWNPGFGTKYADVATLGNYGGGVAFA